MKKIIIVLIVVALSLFSSLSVSAYTDQYVFDYTDSLSYSELQELEDIAGQIEYEFDCCIMICITDENASDGYAKEIYDTYSDNKNGVVMVHDIDENTYYFYVTDAAKSYFGTNELAKLQDTYDSNDSYFGGTEDYYEVAEYALYSNTSVNLPDNEIYATGDGLVARTENSAKVIIVSIVLGMAAGFIIIFAIASKNKSVRMQKNATVYVRPGSFIIKDSYDNFLYKKLDKTPKPKENSKN